MTRYNVYYTIKLTMLYFIIFFINSTSLVQSVERRFPKPDVVGSSPTGRVNLFINCRKINKHNNVLVRKRFKKLARPEGSKDAVLCVIFNCAQAF